MMILSDGIAQWREREIAAGRRFYVRKTLLGGLDVNRRSIYDWQNPDKPVEVWNAEMKPWSVHQEAALQARLDELNMEAKKEPR